MILGIGLDVVEVTRIEKIYSRYKAHFIKKILTPKEKEKISKPEVLYLASRFAVKEAVVKAIGTGFRAGIGFQDIEVVKSSDGKPNIILKNKALEAFKKMGGKFIHVSITHTKLIASAVVIIEN
ncbi:holo-ACP synthase [Desulfonauticus submarinus]